MRYRSEYKLLIHENVNPVSVRSVKARALLHFKCTTPTETRHVAICDEAGESQWAFDMTDVKHVVTLLEGAFFLFEFITSAPERGIWRLRSLLRNGDEDHKGLNLDLFLANNVWIVGFGLHQANKMYVFCECISMLCFIRDNAFCVNNVTLNTTKWLND